MKAGTKFFPQELVDPAMAPDQCCSPKHLTDDNYLEMGLGALWYIVQMAFVYHLHMRRRQVVPYLNLNTFASAHIE